MQELAFADRQAIYFNQIASLVQFMKAQKSKQKVCALLQPPNLRKKKHETPTNSQY